MHRHKLIIVIIIFIFIAPYTMRSDGLIAIQDTDTSSIHSVSALPSGTNLSRVQWRADHNPNHGLEDWTNTHNPDHLYSYRTTEQYTWYAENPWPVNEGSRSIGFQARAIDPLHPSEADIKQSTQVSESNPVNLTLNFDYYIDQNENPADTNFVYLYLRLNSFGDRHLYYYLSGTDSSKQNSSYYAYFELEQTEDIWHSFDRNITEDYYEAFSEYPQQYEYMEYVMHAETKSYVRAFLDDVNLVNGTNTIVSGSTKNGNFESTGFWFISNYDPVDISRTTLRKEGDYALNMTAISNGNRSQGYWEYRPRIRLTPNNSDQFRFWWRINQYEDASNNTHAYINVQCSNATDEFSLYYILASGVESPVEGYPGIIEIYPEGYNSTSTWTYFNRSIWDDVTQYNQTSEVVVEEIDVRIFAQHDYSRLSLIFDAMELEASALNDRGYEDQPAVGAEIRAWDLPDSDPEFTVTDDALNGNKAANLTLTDAASFYTDQEIPNRRINQDTETYLELSWKLNEFTSQVDEIVFLTLSFEDNNDFAYIFANESAVNGEGAEDYIMMPNANSIGQWYTIQRNIVRDYESLFGSLPDTAIEYIYFEASTEAGGRVEILFDDVYLYDDASPQISDVIYSPVAPEADDCVTVNASVFDPALDKVLLHYRIDSGSWYSLEMLPSGSVFSGVISSQDYDSNVEFYVEANDTFGKTTTGLNESVYFQYTVVDTLAPILQFVNPSDSATVSGTVEINASAIDDGSGLSVLVVFLDGEQLFNSTSSPKTFDWDTTTVENGEYTLELMAYDIAGNSDSIEITVTVQNEATTTTTTGTTTDTTPPPLDMVPILIAVAVIAAIAVLVLYFVVLRPRKT
ncbi:hypothetical protein EU537_12780 [Candidatus Thorarchaeota archaeon]|nr:MAG: hypothetical protein EU537_12780 [Candidatus Thorarchaeota archaeon]